MRAICLVLALTICAAVPGQRRLDSLCMDFVTTDPAAVDVALRALEELGAQAATARFTLEMLMGANPWALRQLLTAYAEISAYGPVDDRIDASTTVETYFETIVTANVDYDPAVEAVFDRLRQRCTFPQDLPVQALIGAAQGHRPARVEVAVDHLRMRGAGARAALPALLALLERPEPSVLRTDRRVALHRRVALAVRAIGTDSEVASLVEHVRTHPAGAPAAPTMPVRLRERIASLLLELASPTTRARASTNLVALGSAIAGPVAAALTPDRDPEFCRAALVVLRRLGRDGVDAVPRLYEALGTLSTVNTVDVLETLTATAPWSFDLLPHLGFGIGRDFVTIYDRRIPGATDVEFLNSLEQARRVLEIALWVDPTASAPELTHLLAEKDVDVRERANAIARGRGGAGRSLLQPLARMLDVRQPPQQWHRWDSKTSSCCGITDRSDEIQRLAAEAILAIGRADDPEVAAAKARLAR
ncbi:MAG: hypothetical protein U1E73_11500 [Planctomycetota bacterium]